MPPIRPLANPSRSLIAKLAGKPGKPGVVDRVRQIATNLGARPHRVFLVWTTWSGAERGEGREEELARIEILPTPRVADLTTVTWGPFSSGKLPIGSMGITEISAGQFNAELLRGWRKPDGSPLDERREDFFYEVLEDGRTEGRAPGRGRYRLLGEPFLNAENVEWKIVLERASEDRAKSGASNVGVDEDQRAGFGR